MPKKRYPRWYLRKEPTVRRTLCKIRKLAKKLDSQDAATDQVFGAAEALRWVLGEGPSPIDLTIPLGPRVCNHVQRYILRYDKI